VVALITLACLGMGITGGHLRAGDWREFRGPHGNGTSDETGLPAVLDAARHVLWRAAVPGRGVSSPIIVGDRVFITCSSGARQDRLHVICLRASDGSTLWERQFRATGRTMCHEKMSVATPTPASDGERVYALFSSNDLICLDLEGHLVWLRGLTRDYPNASNSLGMSSSPIVVGDVVVVQIEHESDSFAAGVDKHTGVNRWKIERPKAPNWTSPVRLLSEAPASLVGLQSGQGFAAIDASSGAVQWSSTNRAATIPSAAVAGENVFVPGPGLLALRYTTGAAKPEVLWQSSQLRAGTASPLVAGRRIYCLNDAGVLNCGDARSGERLWQLRLRGPFSGSPVVAHNVLYVFNEKGLGQVIDLNKPEGELTSEIDLGETILCTPAIAQRALFVRSDAHVWKLGGS
jgi:outer membrane protein assembly factor BamB